MERRHRLDSAHDNPLHCQTERYALCIPLRCLHRYGRARFDRDLRHIDPSRGGLTPLCASLLLLNVGFAGFGILLSIVARLEQVVMSPFCSHQTALGSPNSEILPCETERVFLTHAGACDFWFSLACGGGQYLPPDHSPNSAPNGTSLGKFPSCVAQLVALTLPSHRYTVYYPIAGQQSEHASPVEPARHKEGRSRSALL